MRTASVTTFMTESRFQATRNDLKALEACKRESFAARFHATMEIPSVTRALGLHEQYLATLIKILGIK
jgi:hypothetical protein